MKEANDYLLNHFIPLFNKQFGVEAENPTKAYLPNVFTDMEVTHSLDRSGDIITRLQHYIVLTV